GHKYGLSLHCPVMPASGTIGYGDSYTGLIDYSLLGAVVTNPVSLRPRKAARGRRLHIYHDHVVVHTGLPNPGVREVIRKYRQLWERLPCPVIAHIMATTPNETAEVVSRLSSVTGVIGIELGFADYTLPEKAVRLFRAAAQGTLPVIAKIPFGRVDIMAPLLAAEGVSALTLTAPPRVVLPPEQSLRDQDAKFYRGRLYGPSLLPFLLETLSRWVSKLPVPVIACGGIRTAQQVMACMNLGATAVQIDAVIWRTPGVLNQIIHELPQMVNSLVNESINEEDGVDDSHMEGPGNSVRYPLDIA
ncbi:MAG: hypothetical protein P1S60_09290, partial [Anaerolineae bacterium]|nr:hypothetical protein [Anaerolineae bacterium]